MPELQVIARYRVSAGARDEVLAVLPELAEASRSEPGNLSFVAYGGLADDHELVLLERYASRAAFDAHRRTPHFQELVLGRLVALLDSRVVESYDVVDRTD